MADIVLEPGESFEHRHDHVSLTRLVSGQVDYECGETRTRLRVDESVVVPADASHTVRNVGSETAVVYCCHANVAR